jgi:predicted lipoprotein with Yx(FWY)xxD motif
MGSVARMRLAAVLFVLATGGCAALTGDPPPARSQDGVLVDDRGMTLYTYDADSTLARGPLRARKSTCAGECARDWPPFAAREDARPLGDYTPVGRDDGSRQWAYKGKPLYFRSTDHTPGDRTGDGVENLWRVARP